MHAPLSTTTFHNKATSITTYTSTFDYFPNFVGSSIRTPTHLGTRVL